MRAGEKLTAFLELMRLIALRRTGCLGRFMPSQFHFTLVVKAARELIHLLLAFKCRHHIEFEVFHELLS